MKKENKKTNNIDWKKHKRNTIILLIIPVIVAVISNICMFIASIMGAFDDVIPKFNMFYTIALSLLIGAPILCLITSIIATIRAVKETKAGVQSTVLIVIGGVEIFIILMISTLLLLFIGGAGQI